MNRIYLLGATGVVVAIMGFLVWSQLADATSTPPAAEAEHAEGDAAHTEGAAEAGGAHGSEAKVIKLSPEQRKEAGIAVEAVQPGPLPKVFRAPGEVRTNDFATNAITARHQAIIAERKAKLGDKVTKGQPLVGLFSAEMAEAQSAYILAVQESRRVQQLGRDVVAARRYDEAEARRRETRAKLETFGLASSQIDALAAKGRSDHPPGQFDIVAPQAGTIVSDEIQLGAVVEPGKTLFVVTDPSSVWVEAHVSPLVAPEILGEAAKIHIANKSLDARVVQVQQQIDESTRTVGVRLQAKNTDGFLKPGLFVDAELYGKAEQVLSLPTDAIVRGPDGDWTIYVENAKGQLEPKEVEILYTVGARSVVSGVQPGTRVVTQGAFFVMAEAAKAGFDPHNH